MTPVPAPADPLRHASAWWALTGFPPPTTPGLPPAVASGLDALARVLAGLHAFYLVLPAGTAGLVLHDLPDPHPSAPSAPAYRWGWCWQPGEADAAVDALMETASARLHGSPATRLNSAAHQLLAQSLAFPAPPCPASGLAQSVRLVNALVMRLDRVLGPSLRAWQLEQSLATSDVASRRGRL